MAGQRGHQPPAVGAGVARGRDADIDLNSEMFQALWVALGIRLLSGGKSGVISRCHREELGQRAESPSLSGGLGTVTWNPSPGSAPRHRIR